MPFFQCVFFVLLLLFLSLSFSRSVVRFVRMTEWLLYSLTFLGLFLCVCLVMFFVLYMLSFTVVLRSLRFLFCCSRVQLRIFLVFSFALLNSELKMLHKKIYGFMSKVAVVDARFCLFRTYICWGALNVFIPPSFPLHTEHFTKLWNRNKERFFLFPNQKWFCLHFFLLFTTTGIDVVDWKSTKLFRKS